LNNGLLPVVVSDAYVKQLIDTIQQHPQTEVIVDLEHQVVSVGGKEEHFEINLYKKTCMINGYDDIDYLLSLDKEIKAFDLAHS